MNDYLILERFLWFDKQVRSRRYPDATDLADAFGLSVRTAHRNIGLMRHQLGAPLEYDAGHGGYYYADDAFHLPHLEVSQEEILALLLARTLLSQTAGGLISESIERFENKLFRATSPFGLTETRMRELFSATWHGYTPTPAETFRQVTDALLRQRLLHFTYLSPRCDQPMERRVEPHHLNHYMGSWVLIGWCRTREDWRKFYLARMDKIEAGQETFNVRPRGEWQNRLTGAFGIFQGGEPVRVVLRFNVSRARWVREQLWHPEQVMEDLADGSLRLALPVVDFREVKMKIMQFGADVEVVEPETLRREIAAEIAAMAELYAGTAR